MVSRGPGSIEKRFAEYYTIGDETRTLREQTAGADVRGLQRDPRQKQNCTGWRTSDEASPSALRTRDREYEHVPTSGGTASTRPGSDASTGLDMSLCNQPAAGDRIWGWVLHGYLATTASRSLGAACRSRSRIREVAVPKSNTKIGTPGRSHGYKAKVRPT